MNFRIWYKKIIYNTYNMDNFNYTGFNFFFVDTVLSISDVILIIKWKLIKFNSLIWFWKLLTDALNEKKSWLFFNDSRSTIDLRLGNRSNRRALGSEIRCEVDDTFYKFSSLTYARAICVKIWGMRLVRSIKIEKRSWVSRFKLK